MFIIDTHPLSGQKYAKPRNTRDVALVKKAVDGGEGGALVLALAERQTGSGVSAEALVNAPSGRLALPGPIAAHLGKIPTLDQKCLLSLFLTILSSVETYSASYCHHGAPYWWLTKLGTQICVYLFP